MRTHIQMPAQYAHHRSTSKTTAVNIRKCVEVHRSHHFLVRPQRLQELGHCLRLLLAERCRAAVCVAARAEAPRVKAVEVAVQVHPKALVVRGAAQQQKSTNEFVCRSVMPCERVHVRAKCNRRSF